MKKFFSVIKTALTLIIVVVIGYSLLLSPYGAKGAWQGIYSGATSVLPTLFPIMVLSTLVISTRLGYVISRGLSPVFRLLFGFGGSYTTAVLFSFIGGYPLGAKLIGNMLKTQEIDEDTASKLLCISVNPGMGFTIGVIGGIMLSNTGLGIIVYLSHIISVAIISKAIKLPHSTLIKPPIPIHPLRAITDSITGSALAMINVIAFMGVFSSLSAVLDSLGVLNWLTTTLSYIVPLSAFDYKVAHSIVLGLFEVTSGASLSSSLSVDIRLPITSFILGLSGLSVLSQVYSLVDRDIHVLPFILSRLSLASVSAMVTMSIQKLFPEAVAVFIQTKPPTMEGDHSSFFLALCMISMCFMVMLNISTTYNNFKVGD